MTPFEIHGIDHLSQSSINLYLASPLLWCGRYLLGWKEPFGASAKRGNAAETGYDYFVERGDLEKALATAHDHFDREMEGINDPKADYERGNIKPILAQIIEALKDSPKPIATQTRIEHFFEGVEVPVIGFVDYEFEDHGLDLKTTLRMPSSMKPDHARQVALYAECLSKPFDVLYVTPKKFERYPLGQNEAAMHLRDLERGARAIRNLLSLSNDSEAIARCFAPDTSDWHWNETTLGFANELWRDAA